MVNLVNTLIAKELTDELESADGMLLVSLDGLSVFESEDLRGKLAEKEIRFRMIKNSIAKLVLEKRGIEFGDVALTGNNGLAYGETETAINAAKIFTEKDVKKAGKVKIKAALLEGEVLGSDGANALADVPDKDTLRAMMLGVLSGPSRALVGIINALPSGLARVISAHADTGADGADGAEGAEGAEA